MRTFTCRSTFIYAYTFFHEGHIRGGEKRLRRRYIYEHKPAVEKAECMSSNTPL
jgi:hypothetical protein